MQMKLTLEGIPQRIREQFQQQRRKERDCTWLVVERLGCFLLAEEHATGWLDVRTLVRTARKQGIHWGGGAFTVSEFEPMLRNTLRSDTIVQVNDFDVEFTEMPRGKQTTPALKFTRVFPDAARKPAGTESLPA